jgi:tetratricopeptide (TPR) repeat protein
MINRCRGRLPTGLSRLFLCLAAAVCLGRGAAAAPHVPASDATVLAPLPPGTRHASLPAPSLTATRLDIALPLAQLNVGRARATGDLRFLGYAEAILDPWMKRPDASADVLVLHATILQSRHAFDAALTELDRALAARPNHAQAWLVRATVLRVLGRYPDALASCEHLAGAADAAVAGLCVQSLRGLMGHLPEAYSALLALPARGASSEVRAWRFSELGEMAERLGRDAEAERWFREGLQAAPDDSYLRAACADLLLRHGRAAATLLLLTGYEAREPLLLRIAIAHQVLRDGTGQGADESLTNAFAVEEQRGEAVHRREQARFLLDVDHQPAAALAAARENWRVQREPEDALILLRAAQAAGDPGAADPARRFVQRAGLEDSRLGPFLGSS